MIRARYKICGHVGDGWWGGGGGGNTVRCASACACVVFLVAGRFLVVRSQIGGVWSSGSRSKARHLRDTSRRGRVRRRRGSRRRQRRGHRIGENELEVLPQQDKRLRAGADVQRRRELALLGVHRLGLRRLPALDDVVHLRRTHATVNESSARASHSISERPRRASTVCVESARTVEHVVGGVGVGRQRLAQVGEVGGKFRRRAQVGRPAAREEEHLRHRAHMLMPSRARCACACESLSHEPLAHLVEAGEDSGRGRVDGAEDGDLLLRRADAAKHTASIGHASEGRSETEGTFSAAFFRKDMIAAAAAASRPEVGSSERPSRPQLATV
eukprot:6197876-Pleurochrysis_carterae.AAC.2